MQQNKAEIEYVINTIKHFIPGAKLVLFGSRANDTNKPFSDIDVAIKGYDDFPLGTFALLNEEFALGDLPYKVDITDYANVSDEFQKIIDATGIELTQTFLESLPN